MYFSLSPEVRDFLTEQALQEKDPMLRRVLISQAANYATPDGDGRLESTFIDSLGASDDADLRQAAIRGLRYASGESVSEALVKAAADPDEKVRLAAMDVLSARPELRERLSEIVSSDASSHVREIGNCRLLIAQEAQKRK
jgi:HEAT repeat protein